jgi:excisionase family DNA binding protein
MAGAAPSPGGATGDAFSGLTVTGRGRPGGCGVLPAAAGRRLLTEYGEASEKRGALPGAHPWCQCVSYELVAEGDDLRSIDGLAEADLAGGKRLWAHAIAAPVGARVPESEDSWGAFSRIIRRAKGGVTALLPSSNQRARAALGVTADAGKAHQVSQKILDVSFRPFATQRVPVSKHSHTEEVRGMSEGRLVVSVTEAAELLGISRGLAYELARDGQLPSLRLGRRLVAPRAALLTWLGRAARPESRQEIRRRRRSRATSDLTGSVLAAILEQMFGRGNTSNDLLLREPVLQAQRSR